MMRDWFPPRTPFRMERPVGRIAPLRYASLLPANAGVMRASLRGKLTMESNQRVDLGFSLMDACDHCGSETVCSWINSETISVYLCRPCLKDAIARTYDDGRGPEAEVYPRHIGRRLF